MKDDDFKLFRGFEDRQMNRQTDGQTLVIVELLLRLKNINLHYNVFIVLVIVVFCSSHHRYHHV